MSHIHWDRHVSFEWCLKDVNDLCVGAQLFWFGQTVCAHLKFDFLQVWNQFAWSLICFEFEKTDRLMFHLLWVENQFAWSLICFQFEKTDRLKFDMLRVKIGSPEVWFASIREDWLLEVWFASSWKSVRLTEPWTKFTICIPWRAWCTHT